MSQSNTLFPITALFSAIPLPPGLIDWLRVRIDQFDSLDLNDLVIETLSNGVDFSAALEMPAELKLEPAGPTGFALLLDEAVVVRGRTASDAATLFFQNRIRLRFPPELLRPVDGQQQFVELSATPRVRIHWTNLDGIDFSVDAGALTLSPAMIGASGFIISADNVLLSLVPDAPLSQVIDAGFAEGFQGVYVERASVQFPAWFSISLADQLVFEKSVIGTDGFTGHLEALFTPVFRPASAGQPQRFEGAGSGSLFGVSVALQSIAVDIRANQFTNSTLTGELLLPLIDGPLTIDAQFGMNGNALAVTLSKNSPLAIAFPGGSFNGGKLSATGEISDGEGLHIAGSISDGIQLTFGNLLDFSAASASVDWRLAGNSNSVSFSIDQLNFGPLGTLDNAEFRIEDSTSGTSGSLHARMRWSDLAARLSVPEFLPRPAGESVVEVDVRWSTDESGQPVLVLRCAAETAEFDVGFVDGLPVELRPEFRNPRLVFEATYGSETDFSNASSGGTLAGTFSAAIEMRLLQFSGDFAEILEVQSGDNDGWVAATFTATVDANQQANVGGAISNPISINVQIPGFKQTTAPVHLAVESFGFDFGSGTNGAGQFSLKGKFRLRPLTPPTELPLSEHLSQLLRQIEIDDIEGTFDFKIAFANGSAELSLECRFIDAEISIDIFEMIGNLARGVASPAGVDQAIDLDLEIAFGLRGLKLEITPAGVSFKMITGVRVGSVAVDGFLRLSDRELSMGVVQMSIPLRTPVFPLSAADLNLLRQNTNDPNSAWTIARFQQRLAEIHTRITALAQPTTRAEREELALLAGQEFLLKNILNIYERLGTNHIVYQQGVEFFIDVLHSASGALRIDSNVKLNLTNVRFVIPFSDPRGISLEGSASLSGFAPDDPLRPLKDARVTLGLSADQIYFAFTASGDPIRLPDLGRYPGAKVSLTKFTIGYGYTKNSLAMTFAGELILPPRLVQDADTSRTLGAGIRLPLDTKLGFRLDIIPIPGPIPAVPVFDFNLDLRAPNSPPLLDSQTCAPAWDGLQLIVPGVIRAAVKQLAVSPALSFVPCLNFTFDGDLMLGDETTGATLIVDNMLVMAGISYPPTPIPFFASPQEPFFDNLCVSIRLAGFALNFDLQRPMPSFNPLAILEVLGLLSDPQMAIDPDGALANTIRISLKDAYISIPPVVRQLFPDADAVNRKELNITLNLGTIISITQWAIALASEIWTRLERATTRINGVVTELTENPPEISPAAILRVLPPELRKLRVGGAFGGFEARAVILLITVDDAAREFEQRGRQPASTNHQPRLGAAQDVDSLSRFRPSVRGRRSNTRAFYPDEPHNNLFNGIEFIDFKADDLQELPTPQTDAAGVVVGAHVKVFAGQRYRFLGYLLDDGSFGMISAVDIKPLKLNVAGIPVRLPLEIEGRLILEGRARRDGIRGSIRARVHGTWTIIPAVAKLEVSSGKKPARLELYSDGHFAVAGSARLILFNGTTTISGSVDISHTHCFVDGELKYAAAGIVELILQCRGRVGPARHFELSGNGTLKLLGRDSLAVRGVVTENGCAVEGTLDTHKWTIAGKPVDCHLVLKLRGAIRLNRRTLPSFSLEGRGSLEILNATIRGAGGIECRSNAVKTFMEGALTWQGREWLGGRIELGTDGVRLIGRTDFALNLSPSNIAGVELANLFFKVNLQADFTLDTSADLASFGIKGDWALAARLPGDSEQIFPLALQKINFSGSTSLVLELIHIDGFVLVPFGGIKIPIPTLKPATSPGPVRFGSKGKDKAVSWSGTTVTLAGGVFPLIESGNLSDEQTKRKIHVNYTLGFDSSETIDLELPISGDFVVSLVWVSKRLALRVRRGGNIQHIYLSGG